MSIPKVIHCCWFGRGPKPELAEKCIASWKKYCPDYEIVEWNEDNIDLSKMPLYVKEAYARGKWAFVTDYIRLKIVYENGGIYLDTDVELLKPLDPLLRNRCFVGCEGFEYINTGLGFGSEAHFPFLLKNMGLYESLNPVNSAGEFESNPCPFYTTNLLKELGVSFPITNVTNGPDGMIIYPNDYFNPLNWKTEKCSLSKNTYSIHHYAGSWMTAQQKKALIYNSKTAQVEKKLGKRIAIVYSYLFWSRKSNGGLGIVRSIIRTLKKH